MEIILFFCVLSFVPPVIIGIAQTALWIQRALESPAQRAVRLKKEADAKAKAEKDAAAREAEHQRQMREYQLTQMREKWDLYQNVFRVNTMNDLPAEQFELLVADFFRAKGYVVEVVGGVGDFGVDLIVTKGTERMAVQCKRYTANVGPSAIQQAHSGGHFHRCNCYAVVTSSYFTDAAKVMADRLSVKLYWRSHIGKYLEDRGIGTRMQFSEAAYRANEAAIEQLWNNYSWRHPRRGRQYRHDRR